MQELTSSYDDLEKRMAIYLGLGAMIFTSLYLFTQGADIWTYLIRGVLALTVFTVAGWAYGYWLRELFRKNSGEDELPDNVERQSRDAQALEGRVISHADLPEAVIPAEMPGLGETVSNFDMPDFDAPMIPSAQVAKTAARKPAAPLPVMEEAEGDLPPPPVPQGI